MELKELRKSIGLTQPEAAVLLNVPFRTYCRYEDDEQRKDTFKYNQMVSLLSKEAEEAVLKIDVIKSIVAKVFQKYNVSTCYLFGSYARGKATGKSDIDLMIVCELEGIEFFKLLDELETKLNKIVDLLRLETAIQNVKLMNDILREGVKIYGRN